MTETQKIFLCHLLKCLLLMVTPLKFQQHVLKNIKCGVQGGKNSLTVCSAVSTVHECYRQTDRQTDRIMTVGDIGSQQQMQSQNIPAVKLPLHPLPSGKLVLKQIILVGQI